MQYLIILLFLFSAQSYSGEIDNKGIDCVISVKYGTTAFEEKKMWWFNNGLVAEVGISHGMKDDKSAIFKTPSKVIEKNASIFAYYTNAYNVTWRAYDKSSLTYKSYKLNRKKLEIIGGIDYRKKGKFYSSDAEKEKWDSGTCRAFSGFKEVEKRQEELFEKAIDEDNRAREGNKI